jgi:hypothetical protein
MSHEHESPTAGAAADEPEQRPGPEPEFLARARRLLSGDIRPDDYLPVTPEVESRVARDFAFAADHVRKRVAAGRLPAGSAFDPAARFDGVGLTLTARQRNDYLLSVRYAEQNVAYIVNEQGVIVLGVGLEEGGALIDAFPYELRKGVGFGAPEPLDTIGLY